MAEFTLKVWRIHPCGVRIEAAERTLKGSANPDALKWCGPYSHANKSGFWVYPPMDIDFTWLGGSSFDHRLFDHVNDAEVGLIHSLERADDAQVLRNFASSFTGRVKVDFGKIEPNVVQMWTGCIFETPPGWALHIRSPVNIGLDLPYRIQEGVLETDWMRYDIWLNLVVTEKNRVISLRRNQNMPLAQLIPTRREVYDRPWNVSEHPLARDVEEANDVFIRWAEYNYKKYTLTATQKDSGTYYKERNRHLTERPGDPPSAELGMISEP